jgi:hypothetical protein
LSSMGVWAPDADAGERPSAFVVGESMGFVRRLSNIVS